ncbi:MAG TPA: class I SAM-dependent methyltransferase [Armatimonadota bacterium]|nr:class I SAM-dependent methyltransferase [Armatimonadota bacterium]
MSQSRFDLAAATWDAQPARILQAKTIAQAMLSQVPVHPAMTVLDYGCGTGLVTLALHPHVRRIIGVDSSPGMLAKLHEKLQALGITNVETRLLDLATQPPPPDMRADLIVSAMALHHIADIPHLLRALTELLTPGGSVALADLDAEDGSFHTDMTGVHHLGIDRAWLTAQLVALGFQDVAASTAHIVERLDAAGTPRRYPVFLVSGHRTGD